MRLLQIDICMCKHNVKQKCFRSLIQLLLSVTQMKWIWFYIWVYTLFQVMSMQRKWLWYVTTQTWYHNRANIERRWPLSYGNVTLSPCYDQAIPTRAQTIYYPAQVMDHFDVLDNPKVIGPKTADRWQVLVSLHKTYFSVMFLSMGPFHLTWTNSNPI